LKENIVDCKDCKMMRNEGRRVENRKKIGK
jgi:hypothetical protein